MRDGSDVKAISQRLLAVLLQARASPKQDLMTDYIIIEWPTKSGFVEFRDVGS